MTIISIRNTFIFICAIVLLSTNKPLNAETSNQLSPQARIYLLTCDPADELYTLFGHSAIYINDSISNKKEIYNYGTFNFGTPHFYTKFTLGRLQYQLSIQTHKAFLTDYYYKNTNVYSQELNLNDAQKQIIYSFLQENYEPYNRYYLYDFFYDNCATRIRDIIPEVFGDEVTFPESNKGEHQPTFRDYLDDYLYIMPWTKLGINILLGMPADKKTDTWSAMFLPKEMMYTFSETTIQHNGEKLPLVKNQKQVLQKRGKTHIPSFFTSPFAILGIISVILLLITYFEFRQKKWFILIDKTLFYITGLLGLFIIFMWFVTNHSPVKNNLNIIWAIPLNFIFAFFIHKTKYLELNKIYGLLSFIVLIFFIIFHFILPQRFETALLSIWIVLSVRSLFIYYNSSKIIAQQ